MKAIKKNHVFVINLRLQNESYKNKIVKLQDLKCLSYINNIVDMVAVNLTLIEYVYYKIKKINAEINIKT